MCCSVEEIIPSLLCRRSYRCCCCFCGSNLNKNVYSCCAIYSPYCCGVAPSENIIVER